MEHTVHHILSHDGATLFTLKRTKTEHHFEKTWDFQATCLKLASQWG